MGTRLTFCESLDEFVCAKVLSCVLSHILTLAHKISSKLSQYVGVIPILIKRMIFGVLIWNRFVESPSGGFRNVCWHYAERALQIICLN